MFNRLKNYLQYVFGISSTEAKGLLILLPLSVLLLFLPLLIKKWGSEKYNNYLSDQRLLDGLLLDISIQSGEEFKNNTPASPENVNIHLFMFNPNTAGESILDSLGIPDKIITRIINYRNAGGKFRIKNDLMNIYGFPEEIFNRLEPFINLPEQIRDKEHIPEEKAQAEIKDQVAERIDLNMIDSASLVLVRGIGPVFASRIIKYRKMLGGFVSINQLDEVYGIKEPALGNIKNSVFIGEDYVPSKININFCDWKELVAHPYVEKDLANSILQHRSVYGSFKSGDDLRKIKLMTDSIYSKLSPYISY